MVLAVTVLELVVTVAVMVVDPTVSSEARPALLMVATLVVPLVHETTVVRSCVEPSAKVPVALNCWLPVLCETVGEVGVIVIDDNWLAVTISEAVAEPLSWLAVMVVVPVATVVATPALTVATPPLEEVHFAEEVTSFEAPLTVVPEAVKFTVWPVADRREVGETVRLAMESPEVKKLLQPAMKTTVRTVMNANTATRLPNCTRHLRGIPL